jgi:hypothetical protein
MYVTVLEKALSDGKISKTRKKKCSPGRLPGRWPTGPVGGWVGYILFYNQLTKCGCWKVIVKALSH